MDDDRDQDCIDSSPDGVTLDRNKAALISRCLCTMLEENCEHFASVYQDKGNNAAECAKLVEVKPSGNAKSVERQCARKERGHGMETHAFLDTTAMSLFQEVTNRKMKVRVNRSRCHQPTMLFQRMGGRLIGGRLSWYRISRRKT